MSEWVTKKTEEEEEVKMRKKEMNCTTTLKTDHNKLKLTISHVNHKLQNSSGKLNGHSGIHSNCSAFICEFIILLYCLLFLPFWSQLYYWPQYLCSNWTISWIKICKLMLIFPLIFLLHSSFGHFFSSVNHIIFTYRYRQLRNAMTVFIDGIN